MRVSEMEQKELLDLLVKAGFGNLIDVLYHENHADQKVFTKKGRLNKSGACRALNYKPKELEENFKKCRELLGEDWE